MMTLVTHVHLKEGAAREWDATMRTRLSAAKKRPGWVGAQLLRQADKPDRRVIVGTIPAVPLAAGGSGDRMMEAGYRDSLSAAGAFTVVMALHASERPHP